MVVWHATVISSLSRRSCCDMPNCHSHSHGSLYRAHGTPVGSHLMALTSSLWPSNVLRGWVSPSLHTWIILSVLQVAKEVLFLQSTSSVGAAKDMRLMRHPNRTIHAESVKAATSAAVWAKRPQYCAALCGCSSKVI